MRRNLSYYILFLILSAYSCSIPKLTEQRVPKTLPDQFETNTGTAGISKPSEVFQSKPLQKLIDSVIMNNYDLKLALQRINISRANWLQSRASQIPQLQATVLPSLRKFGLYTMDGAGNIVTEMEKGKLIPIDLPDFYVGIQSSWEVDLWGKLKESRKAAALRIKTTEEESQLIKTLLVSQTAGWYYDLLAADEELRMLHKTISLQEQALDFIKLQKEAGKVNELAVQQFDAQLLSMRALQIEVEQMIVNLETSIAQIMGKTYHPIERDTVFFNENWVDQLKSGLPSELLINRPDIRMAEWELLASNADVQVARKSFLPSLNLNAMIGVQGYRPGLLGMFPESIAYSLLSGITGPLLNKRNLESNYQRSKASSESAFLNYEKTVIAAFNEVRQHLVQFDKLKNKYEFKNKEAMILSSSIDVSNDLFKTGRANYLDVLLATQRSLLSNIERIRTRKEQLLTITQLYRSLGGGWNSQ